MTPFFISGTDTDCGKTYVCCQLLDYFKTQGYSAQALKPVASGSVQGINEDIRLLQKHNANPALTINRWCFEPAIAPHIAAKQNNVAMSAHAVQAFCDQKVFSNFDYLLIEGAGGLLVPLNQEETWVDFLRISRIPVILVVGMKLGCINHALLSDAYLCSQNLPYLGWIANFHQKESVIDEEILCTLITKMQAPLLTRLSYCGKIQTFTDHYR